MEELTGHTGPTDPADLKNALKADEKPDEFSFSKDKPETKPPEDKMQLRSSKTAVPEEVHSRRDHPASRSSPEPTCSICLGQLQNKSFTDSCLHTFCFTCLVEWSKVKAECPLCKQQFASIIHNVRSIKDFDRYFVTRGSEPTWRMAPETRRFRYPTTLTPDRVQFGRSRQLAFEQSVAYHRLLFAPHTVSLPSTAENAEDYSMFSSFRRRVYDDDMWVCRPQNTVTRYRCATPEFFRDNPTCRHRLAAWLNRELQALLQESNARIMFILDLILGLITRHHIQSEEFHVHLEPFLGSRTQHFVHEFYNFASSPYEMREYDESVTYDRFPAYDTSIILSSPGSDVVPLPSSSSAAEPSVVEVRSQHQRRKRRAWSKIYLKRNNMNNSWNVATDNNVSNASDTAVDLSSPFINYNTTLPGPSTSRININLAGTSEIECQVIDSDSTESDECMILKVVKPKHERTPEVINLLSDSENEKVPTVDQAEVASSSYSRMAQAGSDFSDSDDERRMSSESFSVTKRKRRIKRVVSSSETENMVSTSSTESLSSVDKYKRISKYDKKKTRFVQQEDISSSSGRYLDPEHSSYSKHSSTSASDYCKHSSTSVSDYCKHSRYSDSTDISDSETSKPKYHKFSNRRRTKTKLRSVVANVVRLPHNSNGESSGGSHSKTHSDKRKKKKHKKYRCSKHSFSHKRNKKG